jgi:hypothetical protein
MSRIDCKDDATVVCQLGHAQLERKVIMDNRKFFNSKGRLK